MREMERDGLVVTWRPSKAAATGSASSSYKAELNEDPLQNVYHSANQTAAGVNWQLGFFRLQGKLSRTILLTRVQNANKMTPPEHGRGTVLYV
jgi:hypothetical protein